MAISGNGNEYDITLLAGASVRTSTSQYLCVGAGATTTSGNKTVYITNDSVTAGTANAYAFVGVNQTGAMSSGSINCNVRMFGVSKVKCASSITEWGYVESYNGASTTTFRGHIQEIANGSSVSAATMSISSHTTVIGRALESGSTNSVISVLVNPQLWDRNLIA
jgi:hypothetical protein